MPASAAAAWPSPGRFALALGLGFALTLAAAWAWGTLLIEAVLPITRHALAWIDDRFVILFLGVDRDVQDTVVRFRVNIAQLFVMGGRVIDPHAHGWLQVTTTTGAMLQPLVIAPAIAFALPGRPLARAGAVALAALLAFAFLLLDLPLTLFAYVWDMMVAKLEPGRASPLLLWHAFLLGGGGRLGLGVALGVAGWWLAHARRMRAPSPETACRST
jgi:hypothetical protein